MANFTKDFVNPYPNGWQDLPSEDTPISADALQRHTNAIEHIEQYLADNPIEGGGSVDDLFYYTDIPITVELTDIGMAYNTFSYSTPSGYQMFDVIIKDFSVPHVAIPSVSVKTDNTIGLSIYNTFGAITVTGVLRVIFIKL